MIKFCFFAVMVIALCGCQGSHNVTSEELKEFDQRIGRWYNYSTVDWHQIDTLYYRPYNGDWPEEYNDIKDESHKLDPIVEVDVHFWHLLQNSRTKFHQDNLHLRRCGNARVCKALDEAEASFDSVFVYYMREDYYSRACVDAYQEVMPAAIDRLVLELNNCK